MAWKVILLIITCLILSGNITNAKERDPLVRLLIKKGVITEEEVQEIETEILLNESNIKPSASRARKGEDLEQRQYPILANKTNNSTDNEGDVKSLRFEVESLHEEVEELRSLQSFLYEPVKVGFGELEIGGLLQLWYSHDETSGKEAGKADSFRLRRTEFMLSGKALPEIAWAVMFDLSKDLGTSDGTHRPGNKNSSRL